MKFGRHKFGGWFLHLGRLHIRAYHVNISPKRGRGIHFYWSATLRDIA